MEQYQKIMNEIISIIEESKELKANEDYESVLQYQILSKRADHFKNLLNLENTFVMFNQLPEPFKFNNLLIATCDEINDIKAKELKEILETVNNLNISELSYNLGYFIPRHSLQRFNEICKELKIGIYQGKTTDESLRENIEFYIKKNIQNFSDQRSRINFYLNMQKDTVSNKLFNYILDLKIKGNLTLDKINNIKALVSPDQFDELMKYINEYIPDTYGNKR